MADLINSDVLVVIGINSKGFGIFPKLIAQDKRITIEAKAIYAYFCSYAGSGNTAFPKVTKIISDLNISEPRYHKHLKYLTNLEYITINKIRSENGAFKHNIYTLNTEISQAESPHQQNMGMVVPWSSPHQQNLCIDNLSKDNVSTKRNTPKRNISNIINKQTDNEKVHKILESEGFELARNIETTSKEIDLLFTIAELSIVEVAIREAVKSRKYEGLAWIIVTLADWKDKGLDTVEKVEGYLIKREKNKIRHIEKSEAKKIAVEQPKKEPDKYENFYL